MRTARELRARVSPAPLVALTLALVPMATTAASPPVYRAEIAQPVTVGELEFPNLSGNDLNNRGEATGAAWGIGIVAVRFAVGAGTVALKAGVGQGEGDLTFASGERINDRGQIFGYFRGQGKRRMFLDTPGGGSRVLENPFDERFSLRDFNQTGQIGGTAVLGGEEDSSVEPWIYTPGRGWRNVAPDDPRFDGPFVGLASLNDRGDYTLVVASPPNPGEEPPYGHQEAFLVRQGTVHALGDLGRPVTPVGELNSVGEVAALSVTSEGEEHAAYFAAATGLVDIHPPAFESSGAAWINEEGVVGGFGQRKGGDDTVFTYTPARGKMTRVAKHKKMRRLVRRAGLGKLRYLEVVTMNERLEFVGTAYATLDGDEEGMPFYASKRAGVHSIQSLLDASGLALTAIDVVDLNDRGELLVDVETPEGRRTMAILTPLTP